jgi:hypothetical protein
MANLIAAGQTAATSSDFTVVAGTPTTIHIGTPNGELPLDNKVSVYVDLKDSANQYTQIAKLDRHQVAVVIDGPGVYRARRAAVKGGVNILVDQD